MPSKSAAQQKLMGAALAVKRGKAKATGGAAKVAATMSEDQLEDFAGTKRKGLPRKVNSHRMGAEERSAFFNGRKMKSGKKC